MPEKELRSVYMRLDELLLAHHPDNPKDHDLGAIMQSIGEFGFVRNVMVNEKDGLLLYGHGTTRALQVMYDGGEEVPARIGIDEDGMWMVPVDRGVRLSKDRARAYVIADNRHSELGGWDEPRLVDSLIALAGKDGRGLRGTGFDGDELDTLIRMYRPELVEKPEDPGAQLDKAEELQKKWQIESGQIWEIGRHRLMCGDSTSEEDVGQLMGGEKAAIVVTDPPYNVTYQDNESVESLRKRNRRVDGLTVSNDSMTDEQFDIFLDNVLSAFPLMDGGVFYLCAPPGHTETQFRNSINRVSGLQLRQCIVWVKDVFVFGRQDYHWRHESILYGWKDGDAHYFVDDRTQDTVWEIDRPKKSPEHPTMKPIELMNRAIKNSSRNGELVFDPFLGSGTTMVAAEQLNRICYGMEIEPKYCAVTLERMQGIGLHPQLIK